MQGWTATVREVKRQRSCIPHVNDVEIETYECVHNPCVCVHVCVCVCTCTCTQTNVQNWHTNLQVHGVHKKDTKNINKLPILV